MTDYYIRLEKEEIYSELFNAEQFRTPITRDQLEFCYYLLFRKRDELRYYCKKLECVQYDYYTQSVTKDSMILNLITSTLFNEKCIYDIKKPLQWLVRDFIENLKKDYSDPNPHTKLGECYLLDENQQEL